jgi:hypothetical protein
MTSVPASHLIAVAADLTKLLVASEPGGPAIIDDEETRSAAKIMIRSLVTRVVFDYFAAPGSDQRETELE